MDSSLTSIVQVFAFYVVYLFITIPVHLIFKGRVVYAACI